MPLARLLRPVLGLLILVAVLAAPAMASVSALVERFTARQPATTTVILIDVSGSIAREDHTLYRQSVAAVANSLRPGDRVLVARVGDANRSRFVPLLDHVVPRTSVRLDQEDQLRRSRERVRNAAAAALSEGEAARHTRILEAVAAASPAFGQRPVPGSRLILLTDAVEESATVDLSRRPLDVSARSKALARARADGLVPALPGLELHIIGAGGRHYASVQAFWRSWAAATGARLQTYGRLPFRSAE
ncbi:hypothetical protein [Thermaurantiacus sp.]